MKVVAFLPPGRFPTVVPDPGHWWSTIASTHRYSLVQFSASATWWRFICSSAIPDVLLEASSPVRRRLRQLRWWNDGIDVEASAKAAAEALERFCRQETYQSASRYIETAGLLSDHLAALNRAQSHLRFSLTGVKVSGLNYASSAALVDYALRSTPLSRLIARTLEECPSDIGMLVVRVTCPEDLLCSMVAVQCLRQREPQMYVCLADHGYENFSLHSHMARLGTTGALERIFDGIIQRRDDRDLVLPELIEAAAVGRARKGFLTAGAAKPTAWTRFDAPSPLQTFSPQPIFWTRLSERRCYWSRCTFCVQNNKYDDPRPPALTDVANALDRLESLAAQNYKSFIFADEALPPAFLKDFCRGVMEGRLKLAWSCRCKLELGQTPELFASMRAAGCYEVLFGLESVSPRMQRLMGKFVKGLGARQIKGILRAASAAGLGIHVNLIGGFPGDTPRELQASVDFLVDTLAPQRNATFLLNRFELFPDSPILHNPEAFGVIPIARSGDMPDRYDFEVAPELAGDALEVSRLIPLLRRRLQVELGWTRWGSGSGVDTALYLYFVSGHGAIFKPQPGNVFSNPFHQGKEGCDHVASFPDRGNGQCRATGPGGVVAAQL